MNNNYNNMDDLFNQLMGNMGGFRSDRKNSPSTAKLVNFQMKEASKCNTIKVRE